MSSGGTREGAGRPKSPSDGGLRSYNWNFILYPESAPENWIEIINETYIEWVCSPLHNLDVNPDGEVKKEHYHITLLYPSKKSYSQVTELTDILNAPIPIRCNSVKGSIRYMVHKDNPEKYQYAWKDIIAYGGVSIDDLIKPTASERLIVQKEILRFIDRNGIIEFSDLTDMCIENDDWLNVILNYSTMPINSYLKSKRHKAVQP